MRYDRDDYSHCDWRASKSDILRNKKDIARKRKISTITVLFILVVCGVTLVTLVELWRMTQ